jgi:hypothetical protein
VAYFGQKPAGSPPALNCVTLYIMGHEAMLRPADSERCGASSLVLPGSCLDCRLCLPSLGTGTLAPTVLWAGRGRLNNTKYTKQNLNI